ncbi:hypothetical protein [Methanothermococcus okinawensis]|uniref:Uncharacterized protein n=1 Tax=Methanothermococcus okinawensis (strain DSM 14208 / JCM 11175 / IH1) TaxID=647113 RepID=F8AMJ4_METOI|nr:hypothetical protein [Methanothermococcus okinawensis]AEH06034.1 hypothetical protein Metok_0036 [Methanothermococcus okinawensis IH1]
MLSDVLYNIVSSNNDDEVIYFSKILWGFYKNNDISKYRNYFKNLHIVERDDLLLYGKNYPLFRSVLYFNEVPLFKSESQSILFLKNNGFNPNAKLVNLNDNERNKLGNIILNKIIAKIPKEYARYVPKLIFGKCYYLEEYNVELKEYISNLNALCKLKKYNEVEKCIIHQKLPDEKLVKKYKLKLAKSIKLFNKKLDNMEIQYTSITYNNKTYPCQYIHIKQSIFDRVKGWIFGSIDGKHYPAIVNISYSHPKINFMQPFFIFVGDEINVFARAPKLLYFKDNLTLNHLNLTGKHTYFGNWNYEIFEKFVNNKQK